MGLRQGTDDYRWIWDQFLDPSNEAYDVENFDADAIWKDPNREFFKPTRGYEKRQFIYSVKRLVKKLTETSHNNNTRGKPNSLILHLISKQVECVCTIVY